MTRLRDALGREGYAIGIQVTLGTEAYVTRVRILSVEDAI